MVRKGMALVSGLLLCSLCMAGEGDYAIANIPRALLQKANVIKRAETMRFEINQDNRATIYHKVAYTILNELGERWSYYSEGYDKLRSIESFEGSLYDAQGKKIKTLKKADIKDVSGSDESFGVDDSRVKWHSFFYKVYPYTVEYEVEVRYKGTMFLPRWIPQEKEDMGVQGSQLKVMIPENNPLRYKMFNYKGEPAIAQEKSGKSYSWEVKDIIAVEKEYSAPAWRELTTSVFLATEKFIIEDYQGSNSSWIDFGRFVYDLKKDRDLLPDEIKKKVHQLTGGITDTREKISRLYDYMQANSRYISIQLGIGGWQPFDAKYVSTKRYGDCKALSNFMYALLKEAGIRSVYTVTHRGNDNGYLMTDLPSSQFNHVILFVPLGKDTTWLECTSQTYVAGYLGGDNGNRYALAIDENGGKLVRTPKYGLNENLEIRRIKATLEPDGTLRAHASSNYSGIQQDMYHQLIHELSPDKVKEFLQEQLDFATYNITKFDYKESNSGIPAIEENLEIVVSNYANITGKRVFIIPNIMTRSNRKLAADTSRRFELDLGFEYRDVDTVEIQLPEGYSGESIPPDISLDSPFGKYRSSVQVKNNKIYYYRSIDHYAGRFPAKAYPELVKFYDAIYKADRNKVVLVKQ